MPASNLHLRTRPERAALLLGIACTFVIGIASAQSNGQWLDLALDRAERLDAPWTPVPKLEQPKTGTLDTVVPAVDAGNEDVPPVLVEPTEPEAREHRPSFNVRSVDEFEDPWAPEAQVEVSTTELVYPWDDKGAPAEVIEPGATSPIVIDDENYPWLD